MHNKVIQICAFGVDLLISYTHVPFRGQILQQLFKLVYQQHSAESALPHSFQTSYILTKPLSVLIFKVNK